MLIPIEIENYSDKSVLVKGDTKKYKEEFKSINGRWIPPLKGWVFSKKQEEKLKDILSIKGEPLPSSPHIRPVDISELSDVMEEKDTKIKVLQEKEIVYLNRIKELECMLANMKSPSSDVV